jgi:hypothetical protein
MKTSLTPVIVKPYVRNFAILQVFTSETLIVCPFCGKSTSQHVPFIGNELSSIAKYITENTGYSKRGSGRVGNDYYS